MKKFFKCEDTFIWLLLFIAIFLIFASLTCKSVQTKSSDEQIEKNNTAIELNKNAVDAVEKSDLTKDEKQEIKSALWNSSGTISESSAKIKQLEDEAKKEFEIKSRLIAENENFKASIKPLKESIFKLIIVIIILSAIIILFLIIPFVRKILYKLSPAGKVLEETKKEIEDEMQIIKDKLK